MASRWCGDPFRGRGIHGYFVVVLLLLVVIGTAPFPRRPCRLPAPPVALPGALLRT